MTELQDDIDKEKERTATLAALLLAGSLTLMAWEQAMRNEIQDQYTRAYVMGRGGIEAMTDRDWTELQALLSAQYEYLAGFRADIAAGGLSEAIIAARSALYIQSAAQAYSMGMQARVSGGVLELPAHPGDGSTICGTNCRCEWDIQKRAYGGWDAYWRVDPAAESCVDCIGRGQRWNPLIVRGA